MKITAFIFVSVLLIAVSAVHAQTTIPHHYARTFENQFYGVRPNQTFATPIDSIKQVLFDHQTQTHSKKTVLSNGQIVIDVHQTWEVNRWLNFSKDSSTYNVNGHETSDFLQYWSMSPPAWNAGYWDSLTYDANGHKSNDFQKVWEDSIWVNNIQINYTYDVNGHATRWLIQGWNDTGWVNSYQYIFTYDVNGNETSSLYQTWNWTWSGSEWENGQEYIFTYNASGNLTSYVDQYVLDTTWVISFQVSLTYGENGHIASALIQTPYGNGWVNANQYSYSYDANGNLTSDLYQTWNGSGWVNNSQDSCTYDANGNLTRYLDQIWLSEWTNNYQDIYAYQSVTGVKETPKLPNQFALSQNYPNPFNPSTQISYTLAKPSIVTLNIYNLLGQQIATLVNDKNEPGEHSISWNALNIPSGVYFYRIVAGDFVQTKKMVLIK